MDNTSTTILAASSQAGTLLTPSLNITNAGAVKGKILRITQIGLFGSNISKDMTQRGASKGSIKIPIICTTDIHYIKPEDREAHEVLLAVQTGKDFDDESRLSLKEANLSTLSSGTATTPTLGSMVQKG